MAGNKNSGNKTAKGLEGNEGNNVPRHLANLPLEGKGGAQAWTDQLNAETTYNPKVADSAHQHLQDAISHVNNASDLAQHVNPAASGFAMLAGMHLANAVAAHNTTQSASHEEQMSQVGSHLKEMTGALGSMKEMLGSDHAPEVHAAINKALESAGNYSKSYQPAKLFKSDEKNNLWSVGVNSKYRGEQMSIDTERDKPIKNEAGEKTYKHGGAFGGYTSPDAFFQKKIYPASMKRAAKNAKGAAE
jgi:hypothetical protein